MKPRLIIAGTIAAIAAIALIALQTTRVPVRPTQIQAPAVTTSPVATLAIDEGEVFVKRRDVWETAHSGETIIEGSSVKTGKNAQASLAFEDIGILRVDQNTEITLTALTTTMVRIYQAVGDTYSKVKRLLDPASVYEVETPTAVASVRGTAFGVFVGIGRESRVVVTQDSVSVAPILEKDGVRQRLPEAVVAPDQGVLVNEQVIARVASTRQPPPVAAGAAVVPKEKSGWLERNRAKDRKIEQDIPATPPASPTPDPVRHILRPIREAIERLVSPATKPTDKPSGGNDASSPPEASPSVSLIPSPPDPRFLMLRNAMDTLGCDSELSCKKRCELHEYTTRCLEFAKRWGLPIPEEPLPPPEDLRQLIPLSPVPTP